MARDESSPLKELERSDPLEGIFANLAIFDETKVKFCLSPEGDDMMVKDDVDAEADDDTSLIVLVKFEGEVVIVLPPTFISWIFFCLRSIAVTI